MKKKMEHSRFSVSEAQTIGRRELLKALAAGGGAVAASVALAGTWVKPVVEVGVLPAHAQGSVVNLTYYYSAGGLVITQGGPAAVLVEVDAATETAYVRAVNSHRDIILQIELDLDGTPSNSFGAPIDWCFEPFTPGASWSVVNYTLGDPTITIASSGGESSWSVVAPLGTGPLEIFCQDGE